MDPLLDGFRRKPQGSHLGFTLLRHAMRSQTLFKATSRNHTDNCSRTSGYLTGGTPELQPLLHQWHREQRHHDLQPEDRNGGAIGLGIFQI